MAFGPNVPSIQAHLCVKGGTDALVFYEKAFGASVSFKQLAEDATRLFHANVELFGGEIMLHDEFPEFGDDVRAPTSLGGASLTINVNRPEPAEVDAIVKRAATAGATIILEPQDVFWGSRYAKVRDPFGHVWAFNAPLTETKAE